MKLLRSALFIPETEPAIHDITKLLLFFNSLTYYKPTETNTENLIVDNLFRNLCNGYTPAPLHEDLNRFNRLVHEMENSRPEDLVRLFSSAQSPIATGQIRDRDEASAGSVVSALQKDNDKTNNARYRERLWQARLILKLAEILDRTENEVTQGMARISIDEQKIFNSLEGLNGAESANSRLSPDFEEFVYPEEKIKYSAGYSPTGSSLLIPIRLKAWAELFLADSSQNRPFILVAPNTENGNTILDRFENTWRSLPQKLFSLSIPNVPELGISDSVDEQFISSRMKLFLEAKENLEFFENFLRETAQSHTTSLDREKNMHILAEHAAAWEKSIKFYFPFPTAAYRKLVFYSFPGVTTAKLLQRLFQLESSSAAGPRYVTSILAIMHA